MISTGEMHSCYNSRVNFHFEPHCLNTDKSEMSVWVIEHLWDIRLSSLVSVEVPPCLCLRVLEHPVFFWILFFTSFLLRFSSSGYLIVNKRMYSAYSLDPFIEASPSFMYISHARSFVCKGNNDRSNALISRTTPKEQNNISLQLFLPRSTNIRETKYDDNVKLFFPTIKWEEKSMLQAHLDRIITGIWSWNQARINWQRNLHELRLKYREK